MRITAVLPLLLAALLVASLAAADRASAGDDGETGARAPKSAFDWIDGFEAGVAAGRRDGRLLLVYVARHKPT